MDDPHKSLPLVKKELLLAMAWNVQINDVDGGGGGDRRVTTLERICIRERKIIRIFVRKTHLGNKDHESTHSMGFFSMSLGASEKASDQSTEPKGARV